MMSIGTKSFVANCIRMWKKKREWTTYSPEVLTFSALLGLPPAECTGMYVESDWTDEQIDEYEEIVDYLYAEKRKERK